MADRHLVVDHLKLSYEGLFNADELYAVISGFFYERGWDWYEKVNDARVLPSGRQVYIELEPWKNISDYYKIAVLIKLIISDMKEIEVEQNNKKIKVNKGVIKMAIDGFVVSDRKSKWNEKPLQWFLSIIFEQYFFKDHYKKAEIWIKSDVELLHQQVKNYLNTFKYNYSR